MSIDAGEEPRCGKCPKPSILSSKNQDALEVFTALAARRVWDGMSGAPRALPLSEIRAEAERTGDPDAIAERVQLLDSAWLEAAFKRIEDRQKRERAKASRPRRR